ncbi:MAG: maltose alpha-D-glucosyltransferase [Candidatus Eremiobacteraeota bacterium]|nr:maltose alpha-D-glucosyltransferase [Candidatus Eremiobacteraeota bacterium]
MKRSLAILALLAVTMTATYALSWASPGNDDSGAGYFKWLEERSMLKQAEMLSRQSAGSGKLWQHPYALPQPRKASKCASVWFTAYPAATITSPGKSIIATLGDEELWKTFSEIGIRAMHTGPMKRSGGIRGREYTPTVDGNFDRISMEIDPAFGATEEYVAMTRNAGRYSAVIIGDIIPGHTGKGADFRLAERGYGDYPGIFHMVAVDEKDWGLLPPVAKGRDSVNLPPSAVDELRSRGYIAGQLVRTIFYEPGVKETDWSATDIIEGADGKKRRWVYLHYFKEGQPTLNWLDPSFGAERLVIGDMLNSMTVLGEKMLRLDANGFLGIEKAPGEGRSWSEGHPLSVTSNEIISMMARKLGGFTFQELNLTLEDIKTMAAMGADLSYDFVTRPAYHHALVTGNTQFLRLMFSLMKKYGIDPAGLIHALQNHDELTLELVHFWSAHGDEIFRYGDREIKGKALREEIRRQMFDRLIGPAAPYNLKASNGISCTTASLCAAVLGVRDLQKMTAAEKEKIKKLHLLLVIYNAFQPGVLALSGWDLVGALTLPSSQVKELLADGDTRWVNRGAYDLMGKAPSVAKSAVGLPRAVSLYGSLPLQMKDPSSFARSLQKMLRLREKIRIAEATLLEVPAVKSKSLLVLIHALPDGGGTEVTAINFGQAPVEEPVTLSGAQGLDVTELLEGRSEGKISSTGSFLLKLGGYEGKILLAAARGR